MSDAESLVTFSSLVFSRTLSMLCLVRAEIVECLLLSN